MNRYLSSFFITSILYSIIIGVFLFTYTNQKPYEPKKVQKKKISLKHVVLLKKELKPKVVKKEKVEPIKEVVENKEIVEKKIIEPIKEVVKKEIIVEKQIPKIEKLVKKEIPKKIVKKPIKKPIKKPKKIVKKTIKKKLNKKKTIKKIVKNKTQKKKEIIKKEAIKVINEPTVPTPIVHQKVVSIEPIVDYKQNFLKNNLLLIKQQIQKHVKYSKRARRMSIQGNVIVQFELLKDGTIKNIKALSGHKLLRKSTIKAIKKAATIFPKVHKNITIKVPIQYKLI